MPSTPLIALAAGLALAAAHPHHPGYSRPHSSPPCVPTHTPCSAATFCCGAERCTPAPWDVAVPYQCLPSPPACYGAGARCAGAPHYPFVPYAKCCGGEACVEDAEKGWGRWCVESGIDAPAATAPVATEVEYEAVATAAVGDEAVGDEAVADETVAYESVATQVPTAGAVGAEAVAADAYATEAEDMATTAPVADYSVEAVAAEAAAEY